MPTLPRPAPIPGAIGAPLDALWQAGAIVWVLLAGEGLAAMLTLAAETPGGRWIRFGVTSLLVQWVALLTLGMLYVMRERLRGWRPLAIAWLALALLVINSTGVVALGWQLMRDVWVESGANRGDVLVRTTLIALIVGLLALAAFQNHWHARQLAVRAKQAELAALQARVRPHFLFNTLNTGAALVHHRPDDAEQLLLDLADLFRAALSGPRVIPLHEEIALVKRYLEIEGLRFGERLRVRWALPDPIPAVDVPSLSLQPLVENAIRHGIERIPGGGEVTIAVTREGEMVRVVVDNPMPADAGTSANTGHNVGLAATSARIEAHTGGLGTVEANARDGRFIATVTLPMPA